MMDCNEDILLYKSFVLDYSATSVPQNKALMGLFSSRFDII